MAGDTWCDAATNPDRAVVVFFEVDATSATEASALACDVGGLESSGFEQPTGEPSVEAARDRVFGCAPLGPEERSDLDSGLGSGRVVASDADVEVVVSAEVGLQGQHGIGIGQEHTDPARTIVNPSRLDDILGGQAL